MAKQSGQSLKRYFLLAFVGVSMILIGIIWADGLADTEPVTPGYYRNSYGAGENIFLTVTAQARNYERRYGVTPTPRPHRHHSERFSNGEDDIDY